MKNTILIILLSAVMLVVASCEKDSVGLSTPTAGESTWIPGVTAQPNLYMSNTTGITVISNGSAWTDQLPSIDITGSFKNNEGNPISFEHFSLGGVLLEPSFSSPDPMANANGRFRYHFNRLQEDSEQFLRLSSIFSGENNVSIGIKSRELGEFAASMPFPLRLEVDLLENTSYSNNPFVIDLSEGIIIKWNAEPPSEKLDNSVGVAVIYSAGISQLDDPTMPPSLPAYVSITDDDGELFIPASELNQFPEESTINVIVARGNYETYTISSTNNSVTVNGVTYEISKGLLVVR
jgi:hypothetical protein